MFFVKFFPPVIEFKKKTLLEVEFYANTGPFGNYFNQKVQ